jgi:hypothetical protein
VPDLLHRGLVEAGVDPDSVLRVELEDQGLPDLLAAARPGDLVVVSTFESDWAWEQITEFKGAVSANLPSNMPL